MWCLPAVTLYFQSSNSSNQSLSVAFSEHANSLFLVSWNCKSVPCVCSVVGVIGSECGGHPVPVFLYCNYLMVWVKVVLIGVFPEHILLGKSCVWFCFPVRLIWGFLMTLTDVFLKRIVISFQIQCFSLLVFPKWAWFCCCFSLSMRVKRVPLKSLWPVWTPPVYSSLLNVSAIFFEHA